jgi:DNA-binding NarL/FixJ family response regulator
VAERINRCPARDSGARRKSQLLTPAQKEVRALALEGLTNAEIAEERGTTIGTVKNHLQAVYDKLGVRNRVGLILRELGRQKQKLETGN